jgi:hypothetical protein
LIFVIACIAAGALFGFTVTWAVDNKTLTDGQYIGYPLVAAMLSFCIVGYAWEYARAPKRKA